MMRGVRWECVPWRTIWLDGDAVAAIDQRRLPGELAVVRLRTAEEAAAAIRDMAVRGAPLIGVTAAFGLALALAREATPAALDRASALLRATRPTPANPARPPHPD